LFAQDAELSKSVSVDSSSSASSKCSDDDYLYRGFTAEELKDFELTHEKVDNLFFQSKYGSYPTAASYFLEMVSFVHIGFLTSVRRSHALTAGWIQ
jgi:hypothetical protein